MILVIAIHPTDTNTVFWEVLICIEAQMVSTPAHDWIGGYNCDLTNP